MQKNNNQKVYAVNVDDFEESPEMWDNEKFLNEAKKQGLVFSFLSFQTLFNNDEICQSDLFIRIV
jgi:hypothetical protein